MSALDSKHNYILDVEVSIALRALQFHKSQKEMIHIQNLFYEYESYCLSIRLHICMYICYSYKIS